MKWMLTLIMAVIIVGSTGCNSAKKTPTIKLSDEELKQLCAAQDCELSRGLKDRLIANSKELKLTEEEMEVLKSTGKVVLCGKCGYILNSKKYKEAQKKGKDKIVDKDHSGFADDSIRDRILGPYIN